MLFQNIAIIDENYNYVPRTNLVTEGAFITYIGTEVPRGYSGQVKNGKGRLLMPAFVNTHAHSPMTLLRGYGENMKLQDWLPRRIFPFEAHLTGEAVYWGTLLAIAESLRFGIVSTSDMYYFLDDMVRAFTESGAKANIGRGVSNMTGEPFEVLESAKDTERMIDRWHNTAEGRIRIDASLHAEYTSDEQTARGLAALAKEKGVRMQVHVSETKKEREECKMRHGGRTPVRYLADTGLFDVPTIAAHCVWLEESDLPVLKEKGVTVATNPVSNLKLASGICDIAVLRRAGIAVTVGTDSVSSNNNLSMLEEMKTMSLLAKLKGDDPTLITPREAIAMATAGGAKAQGREDTGLLQVGKRADLIMLRTDVPNMNPVHDMCNNIVLSCTDADIAMTMADGRVLYENGEFSTIDIDKTVFHVKRCTDAILREL